jgi:hypothetical protein
MDWKVIWARLLVWRAKRMDEAAWMAARQAERAVRAAGLPPQPLFDRLDRQGR